MSKRNIEIVYVPYAEYEGRPSTVEDASRLALNKVDELIRRGYEVISVNQVKVPADKLYGVFYDALAITLFIKPPVSKMLADAEYVKERLAYAETLLQSIERNLWPENAPYEEEKAIVSDSTLRNALNQTRFYWSRYPTKYPADE